LEAEDFGIDRGFAVAIGGKIDAVVAERPATSPVSGSKRSKVDASDASIASSLIMSFAANIVFTQSPAAALILKEDAGRQGPV
jgi:hypothetical protein